MRSEIRKSGLCLCGLLAAAVAAGASAGLESIFAKNQAAVFGQSQYADIVSIELDLTIAESDYELTAWYRATVDGRMRIDVFSGADRVFSEGIDEQGVWEWPAGQDTPAAVDHEGAGALEHGVEFKLFSLSELARRGHSIEWSGQETLQATDYDVLKVTMKDGFETYRYVNRETGLVDLSRDFRAFHPGIDATRQHLHTSRNFAPDKQQETNR